LILPDFKIRELCERAESPLVTPYLPELIREVDNVRMISFGQSSMGYDLRLSSKDFRVFSPIAGTEIDPKRFDENTLVDAPLRGAEDGSKYFLLPPHSYALGVTIETFHMPSDVLGICTGKSTYARCGLIVNTTPLEPGWRGRLVLEFSNSADLPVRLYAGEGIAQAVFFQGETCATSYADRAGKYQDQAKLVTAKV
jgi:dCTP deaminase